MVYSFKQKICIFMYIYIDKCMHIIHRKEKGRLLSSRIMSLLGGIFNRWI